MTGAIFQTFGEAYQSLVRTVREHGVEASPRGKAVSELRWPQMWHITNPSRWPVFISGRALNPFFALAEVVWMWSGKGGAEFITFYNKSISQFLDEGIPYFHGSYGRRVRHYGYDEHPFRKIPSNRAQPGTGAGSFPVEVDQLFHVLRKLRQDPHTRQAVVSLWDPIKDNLVSSKDHPCNNILYFQQRDGALHITIVRRSNDVIWGVPYNMCQFTHLHALMAGELELKQGHYTVMANNLHAYHDLYPETYELVNQWAFNKKPQEIHNTYRDWSWDMDGWGLHAFTKFITSYWEPFEQVSRRRLDADAGEDNNPFYEMQRIMLMGQVKMRAIPQYWCDLFLTLLAYHAAKAKAYDVFKEIFTHLPSPLQWLIVDFWGKKDFIQDMATAELAESLERIYKNA